MEIPSQRFDRQLFTLKLSELSHEMQERSEASDRKAGTDARNGNGSLLLNMAAGQLALLRDWLEGVDRICREVWETQGETVTPEFVRDILLPEAMTLIDTRKGTAMSNVGLVAARTRDTGLQAAQQHLTMEMNKLKSKVSTKYEIEVQTLAHKKVRRVSQLPVPIRTLRGGGIVHSTPKPTEVPASPPIYFPGDLWPKTNLILLEAQRKFPLRTRTLELCRHIVAEMTPVLHEAVRAGKLTANAALTEGLGGMADLLHSILVWNDDGTKSGLSSLSEQAYRLGQDVRKSDEWLALARTIADAQHEHTQAERFTVEVIHKQEIDPFEWRRQLIERSKAEKTNAGSSQSEHGGKTTENVVTQPTSGAAIGRNIDRLRKECGWSFDKLAEETGIDKKLILSHVNKGTKPIPRILREYAQAFSKALGRKITAPDLEK